MVSNYWNVGCFINGSQPEPILRDVFSGWDTGDGIFNYLESVADMPWKDVETVYTESLDISYFGNHSGGKFCSPLVKLVIDDEGEVPATARAVIAKILVSKYLPNWQHLWETNIVSYSPIHNYDMTENRTLRTADSMAEKVDRESNDTVYHGMTNEETDYKFGLNTVTSDVKPSDRINSTEGGSTSTEGESNNQTNRVNAGEEEEEIHRAGNIGVTTTQKLLEEERALWIWNYFDQIFKDLDRELALMFHDPCRV